MQQQAPQKKWYQKTFVILILMIVMWPLGVYLAWKHTGWSRLKKVVVTIITAFLAFIFLGAMLSSNAPYIMIDDEDAGVITTQNEKYMLKGRVNGGDAQVTVNSKEVKPDSIGNFSFELQLKPGDNNVVILATRNDKTSEEVITVKLVSAEEAAKSKESGDGAEQQAAKQEPKDEYAVGEAASINDRMFTVTEVQRNFTGSYSEPDAGKEHIVVTVSIENSSSTQLSFNAYDFKVQDSDGVQTSEAFVTGVQNKLNSGTLAPGGKVTGTLAFEVPVGDAGLKLLFQPSFWSNKSVTVRL